MLSLKKARNIGYHACIDRLGRDFVKQYEGGCVYAYAKIDNDVHCYVGVDPDFEKRVFPEGVLILSSAPSNHFPYEASCLVDRLTGQYRDLTCNMPTA